MLGARHKRMPNGSRLPLLAPQASRRLALHCAFLMPGMVEDHRRREDYRNRQD
jgi:hypothetical protein